MHIFFSSPPSRGAQSAILLDRDGVVNERVPDGYVTCWDQFRFVDGMVEALASLARLQRPIIIVSNQACVGKGLIDESRLVEITRHFVEILSLAGGRIDAVYYCPHRPSDKCRCRKPRVGLLEQASRDWHIDLSQSVLVGDSPSDLEAAAAVRCQSLLFNPAETPAREIANRVSSLLSRGKITTRDDSLSR